MKIKLKIVFFLYLMTGSIAVYADDAPIILSQKLHNDYAALYISEATEKTPPSPNILAIGEAIFFDQTLSQNNQMSCATCHKPELGFTDGLPKAIGNAGYPLQRKTMTLYNIGDDPFFFWDGSVKTLEEQFFIAIENPKEMALSKNDLLKKITQSAKYKTLFHRANQGITLKNIAFAVSQYVANLRAPRTRFDAWLEGDMNALSKEELLGFKLFNNKANCNACHHGSDFTDNLRNDIGLDDNDLGYGALTKNPDDYHFFKTTGLRAIQKRAPYMHHGALETLEDVIDHYNDGQFKRGDTDIPDEKDQGDVIAFHNFTQPLNLTEKEKQYLVAFLRTL